ncbi:MAG TPA: AAA family ATPase [Acidimicrobiales bacterium]|nr:AAA family ATPase [Acidimicrobiales bacterium]
MGEQRSEPRPGSTGRTRRACRRRAAPHRDPAQHSAVAAGGGWRALLERYPEDRAELTERRRQMAPEMTEVRLASVDYAAGRISEAVERLRFDDRVVEADSPQELLDALAADWYVDRLHRASHPEHARSSMFADHHLERRELNARARGGWLGRPLADRLAAGG